MDGLLPHVQFFVAVQGATFMTINGQSGVGMLLPTYPQPMSDAAFRIVRCAASLRMHLLTPQKSAWFDAHVFELDSLLRGYAADYIAQACQDLDALAMASKEAAAGRPARAPKARSAGRSVASGGVTC